MFNDNSFLDRIFSLIGSQQHTQKEMTDALKILAEKSLDNNEKERTISTGKVSEKK